MEFSKDIEKKLVELEKKYTSIGQDLGAYMDGLLYANPLHYWEYTKVDTLLSLQEPRTDFPDELIFIIYHQITELYFRLALHEIEQIAYNGKIMSDSGQDMGWNEKIDPDFFADRLRRINQYFQALTKSFDVMTQGMDKEQFVKFRMSLLPASGFQSAQYRLIEMGCADLINITQKDYRELLKEAPLSEKLEHLYWKRGATELESGKKTLTLKNFEKKYMPRFLAFAQEYEQRNIWKKYTEVVAEGRGTQALWEQMRWLDVHVNINWPLVHYKTAVRYLSQEKGEVPATGGTNWQQYLPPRFQKRIFFPELWSEQEQDEWGKAWVESVLRNE